MSEALFRVYDPDSDPFDGEGYPLAWRQIKHLVREQAGHRCVRCLHPYRAGEHASGEWTACDEACLHLGPLRVWALEGDGPEGDWWETTALRPVGELVAESSQPHESRWRILTVHHLDGVKANCRWWNLAPLDQRCHLTIQGRVKMERPYEREHSAWFRPYAAGYYAWKYLNEDLGREETEARIAELLALELRQVRLEGFPDWRSK